MQESTNRKVLTAVADADNRHDVSGYAEWFADDVVVHLLGDDVLEGLDAYTAFMRGLFAGMPDYHAVAHDEFARENGTMQRQLAGG